MRTHEEQEVIVERELTIDARPETVWEFLVDPELAVRWMGTSAELDPRPGGAYRVKVRDYTACGEFVEVDHPRRLVWTWGWEPEGMSPLTPGSTTVEVELEPEGSATALRFRHRGFANAAEAGRHEEGWAHYLDRLAVVAKGDDPGADTWRPGA
jgi:uncharacterized protein YndB with AHSA1/START domain